MWATEKKIFLKIKKEECLRSPICDTRIPTREEFVEFAERQTYNFKKLSELPKQNKYKEIHDQPHTHKTSENFRQKVLKAARKI